MATSKELFTNLADELRDLTNTTDKMGLSKMAEHVADANDEVDEQSTMIDELLTALEGKAVGGGSGAGVETCTVTITTYAPIYVYLGTHTTYDGELHFNDNGGETSEDPVVISGNSAGEYVVNDIVVGSVIEISAYSPNPEFMACWAERDGVENYQNRSMYNPHQPLKVLRDAHIGVTLIS